MHNTAGNGPSPELGRARLSCRCSSFGFENSRLGSQMTPAGTFGAAETRCGPQASKTSNAPDAKRTMTARNFLFITQPRSTCARPVGLKLNPRKQIPTQQQQACGYHGQNAHIEGRAKKRDAGQRTAQSVDPVR